MNRLFCRLGMCDSGLLAVAVQPRAWYSLHDTGRLINFNWPENTDRPADTGGTLENFKEALRASPSLPVRWCDLGDALLRNGQRVQAVYCFSQALDLSGNPGVVWRVAKSYLSMGADAQAFDLLSRLLRITRGYDNTVFALYDAGRIRLDQMLRYMVGENRRAAASYAYYLFGSNSPRDAEEVWRFVLSRNWVDERLLIARIDFLLRNKKYDIASREWAGSLGQQRDGYLLTNMLFNGDFEQDLTGSAFDWRIARIPKGQAFLDTRVAHSGRRSLCIRLGRPEDRGGDADIIQLAYVTPGTYHFEAYVRTENLAPNQGIGFRIFDWDQPARLDDTTEHAGGSIGWNKIEATVAVSPDTKLLAVQVNRRRPASISGNVQGTAWIDSVALTR